MFLRSLLFHPVFLSGVYICFSAHYCFIPCFCLVFIFVSPLTIVSSRVSVWCLYLFLRSLLFHPVFLSGVYICFSAHYCFIPCFCLVFIFVSPLTLVSSRVSVWCLYLFLRSLLFHPVFLSGVYICFSAHYCFIPCFCLVFIFVSPLTLVSSVFLSGVYICFSAHSSILETFHPVFLSTYAYIINLHGISILCLGN